MIAKVRDITKVPDKITGVQKSSVQARGTLVSDGGSNELGDVAALWSEISRKVTARKVLEVVFSDNEEAERIGLQIDAISKGAISVGINGTTVHFWRRNAP